METNPKAVCLAGSLGDACATLRAIVAAAKDNGDCLTDRIYRTDYVTRSGIIQDLCCAYARYIDCAMDHEDVGAVLSERAAVLTLIVARNVKGLPEAIKEYLKKIEDHDVEIDSDKTGGAPDFDSVTQAADDAAKTADRDIDYTYKARLATAAMNIYCGIYNPGDFDLADVYIGLRLTAIKLQKAIEDATCELSLSMCSSASTPWAGINAAIKLLTMADETVNAQVFLFGLAGVIYGKADSPSFDGDMEIMQAARIINEAAAAKDKDADALLTELDFAISDLPDVDLKQAKENLCKALTTLQKLVALRNAAPEQQEPDVDDIHSSGVIGNALKE